MKVHISRERLELIDFSLLEKEFRSWMEIANLTRSSNKMHQYEVINSNNHVFVGIYTCIS